MSPIVKADPAIIALHEEIGLQDVAWDDGVAAKVSANSRLISGRAVRWDEERARAAYSSGWWVGETLADAAKRAAKDTPERVVIVDGDTQLNCRELYDQASALAQTMLHRVPEGSVVSFMLPNWHEAAVIYLAATLAGMVVHPILPSLRDRELTFMLGDAASGIIFIPAQLRNHDYRQMLERVSAQLANPPLVVVVRGESGPHMAYDSWFARPPQRALPALDADAVRMALYTSGTTGTPKGVVHSHNSIHALIRQIGKHWLVEPGDTFLVASPLGHIGGSIYAFECPLLLGTRAVLMDRWDADAAVRTAIAQRCTHMAGATPFLEQLLAAAQRAGTRLPDLKLFVCGGASVPPSLIRQAAAYFSNTVVTRVYGSTEVPVTTVGTPTRADMLHAADTDGRPGIAELKLTDASGASGTEGEIRVRGPQMLVGYLHTRDGSGAFDPEGYFQTGDIGRWFDGEYLVVSGRVKDIIIRNGENISPKEIEDVLMDHPNIAEIAVVGVPDARTGERACAVIVAKHVPAPDVDGLRAFLGARGVAAFKYPEQVAVWESLPKNAAGKVLKHQVRTVLMQRGQGS